MYPTNTNSKFLGWPRLRYVVRIGHALLVFAAACCSGQVFAADVFKGQQLYGMYCAACHGPAGISIMPGSPNFARQEALLQPDLALLNAIRTGKNAMPAFQGILRDTEILDVIAYVRTLR